MLHSTLAVALINNCCCNAVEYYAIVVGYMVLYTQNPDLPPEEWQVKSVAGAETQTILANLTLNVTYNLRVQARNSIGYSPLTSNSVFYSKPIVYPGFSFSF